MLSLSALCCWFAPVPSSPFVSRKTKGDWLPTDFGPGLPSVGFECCSLKLWPQKARPKSDRSVRAFL